MGSIRVPDPSKFTLEFRRSPTRMLYAFLFYSAFILARVCCSTTAPIHIGVLAEHDSSAWESEYGCVGLISDHRKRIECNLDVYEAAVETASTVGVKMLLLPEGYGLGASSKPWGFFEPFNISLSVGLTPCMDLNRTVNPQLVKMVSRCSPVGTVSREKVNVH